MSDADRLLEGEIKYVTAGYITKNVRTKKCATLCAGAQRWIVRPQPTHPSSSFSRVAQARDFHEGITTDEQRRQTDSMQAQSNSRLLLHHNQTDKSQSIEDIHELSMRPPHLQCYILEPKYQTQQDDRGNCMESVCLLCSSVVIPSWKSMAWPTGLNEQRRQTDSMQVQHLHAEWTKSNNHNYYH